MNPIQTEFFLVSSVMKGYKRSLQGASVDVRSDGTQCGASQRIFLFWIDVFPDWAVLTVD
jgi:hypothetical protein